MGAWVHKSMGSFSAAFPMALWTHGAMNLAQLRHELTEQGSQTGESRVAFEILLHVSNRARNVLDVDRVSPDARLIAEGPERFEVPLERHHVEPLAIRALPCEKLG